MSQIEREFDDYDQNNLWHIIYQKIKNEAATKSLEEDFSVTEARRPENRSKNRYRDVSPYDHSRVVLLGGDNDYINASLLEVPQAKRKYILSQGPLEHTSGHFWQMIWEKNTKAILMLNRVIEKGTVKCYQYWPVGEDDDEYEMVFEDVNLKVTHLGEEFKNNYFIRKLELEELETGKKREIFHFHYISWPDFGVPPSPVTFLNFLMAVRQEGVLEQNVGPAVIHCSAGIGRSGTFCLVDSSLVMIESNGSLEGLDLKEMLIDMRSFRMGLIQTHDQLRFSYQAVIEGGHRLLQNLEKDIGSVMDAYMDIRDKEKPPPPPPVRTSSLPPQRREELPPPPPCRDFDPGEEVGEGKKHSMQDKEEDEETKHIVKKIKTEHEDKSDSVAVTSPDTVTSDIETQNNNSPGTQKDGTKKILEESSLKKSDSPDSSHPPENNVQLPQKEEHSAESGYGLRKRQREERKKATQVMINEMREKQRKSEILKKRKSYLRPIAIGLTLLIGGILLYKYYW